MIECKVQGEEELERNERWIRTGHGAERFTFFFFFFVSKIKKTSETSRRKQSQGPGLIVPNVCPLQQDSEAHCCRVTFLSQEVNQKGVYYLYLVPPNSTPDIQFGEI